MLKWEELRKITLRRRQITHRIKDEAINNVTEKNTRKFKTCFIIRKSKIVFIFTQSRGYASLKLATLADRLVYVVSDVSHVWYVSVVVYFMVKLN